MNRTKNDWELKRRGTVRFAGGTPTPNTTELPIEPYPRPELPEHVDRSELDKDRSSMWLKSGTSEGLPYRPTSIAVGKLGRAKRTDAKNWKRTKQTEKVKHKRSKAARWLSKYGK